MGDVQQLSDSELELMRVIWAQGGRSLFAQVMQALADRGKDWKPNTVLTFLSRLCEKGALTVEKHGRRNEYVARLSEEAYASQETGAFLNRVYEGNAKGLVTALLRQNRLTSEDVAELQRFWGGRGERP